MNKVNKKRLIWLGIIVLIVLYIVVSDSSLLTNTKEIRGGFTEVAFNRNENNSGPVVRIYAVKVDSPLVADFDSYGSSMPHTEHGTTKIFFFDAKQGAPEKLSLQPPYYDTTQYSAIWVFQKNAVGKTTTSN
ncbi:hypothetical protein [Albibacterium indicum]|uniref:hypothetical protein n=1 Tax=Albibacterium indicum TaxID=2292082 RepID=UPI000E5285EE|nr:hypothetical protein [Pedobacter indicus]